MSVAGGGLPGLDATSVIVTVVVLRALVSPAGMVSSTVTRSGSAVPNDSFNRSPASFASLSGKPRNESVLLVSAAPKVTSLDGVRM